MTALLSLLQASAFPLGPTILPSPWESSGETTPWEAGAEEAGGAQTLMLLVGDLPDNYGAVGKTRADRNQERCNMSLFLVH